MRKPEKLRIEEKVLILTLFVQVLLLVNQTVVLAATARQTMTASMMDPGSPEALRISITTDTGRPRSLLDRAIRALLEVRWLNSWLAEWLVGGQTRTQATVAISITVTGSNVQSTATVDYYVEARSGTNTYKFLQATGTQVTVGGAALQASDQRTIDSHLTLMGLSTTQSQTIDYYVYVKAEATGAVSGGTLVSEVAETKFDTVTYAYGPDVTQETLYTDMDTYVDSTQVWNNYGYDYYMYTDNEDSGGQRYGLVQWIITGLPDGATIESAEIECRLLSTTTVGWTCTAYRNTEAFSELSVTWDDRPSLTTGNSAGSGWPTPPAWQSWTVTDQFDDAYSGGSGTYYGVTLVPTWSSKNRYGTYYTSDKSASYQPRLNLEYIAYESSWYPLPPLSLASLPITLDVVALTALIAATALVLRESRRRMK